MRLEMWSHDVSLDDSLLGGRAKNENEMDFLRLFFKRAGLDYELKVFI